MSIETQLVDNPYGSATGQRKTEATVNTTTTMGGFAKFGGSKLHQREAAKLFRSIHDMAEIGGAKAIDLTQDHVDGGNNSPEALLRSFTEASAKKDKIKDYMDDVEYKHFCMVVCGDMLPTTFAKYFRRKKKVTGNDVAIAKEHIFAIADKLSRHFGQST